MSEFNFEIVKWNKNTRTQLNKSESQKGTDATEFKGQCLWDCIKNMGKSNGKDLTDTQIMNAINEIKKDNNIKGSASNLKIGTKLKVEEDVMQILGFEKPEEVKQEEPSTKTPVSKDEVKTPEHIAYAQEAGQKFKDFSDSTDEKEVFQFTDKRPKELGMAKYKEALVAASQTALENYDTTNDGTVTQEEIIKSQQNSNKKMTDLLKRNSSILQTQYNEQANLLKTLNSLLEQKETIGADTTKTKELISKAEQQLKHLELMKKNNDQKLAKEEQNIVNLAKTWASLDGDDSSVSQKDMAMFLGFTDASGLDDEAMNGKIHKTDEASIMNQMAREGFLENQNNIDFFNYLNIE